MIPEQKPTPGPSTRSVSAPSNPSAPPVSSAGTDWTSDPIYQLVTGQQNLAINQAKAEALKQQSQAVIAYGDPNLALAITGDQNVAAAAGANKASTLAQLVAENQKNVRDVNETENKNNTFYSSDRGYQLGLAQQAYLNNTAQALSGLQQSLGQINTNRLSALQAARFTEQQAASDAYNRAVANPPGIPSSSGNQSPPAAAAAGGYGGVPKQSLAAHTAALAANKTGGSANVKQGVFSVH